MIDFQEIAVLDRNALYLGVPTLTLMENAGTAVVKVAQERQGKRAKSVAIFCGLGNNGGDGLVAARHFAYDPGYYVVVYLLGDPADIKSTMAIEQLNRLPERIEVVSLANKDARNINTINLTGFGAIIDAMLGVGITGKLKNPYRAVVNHINSMVEQEQGVRKGGKRSGSAAPRPTVISVDVPTGLGTDTALKPDITVTFHDSKTGMTKKNSGRVVIGDIGIPKDAERFTGPGELTLIPKLGLDSHKGDRGKLLIVCGGPYTGAPGLVGLSALRTGVDLVHIAAPKVISNTIASFSPNFIMHPLEPDQNQEEDHLIENNVADIITLSHDISANAIVIGPGLGRADETMNAVNSLLKSLPDQLPIVLDADGLTALATMSTADQVRLLKSHTGVLTPHRTEFQRLLGAVDGGTTGRPGTKAAQSKGKSLRRSQSKDASKILKRFDDFSELQVLVKEYAHNFKQNWTVLYKGTMDIITDGVNLKLNRTGNPGMTVGGTGDVLAGINGALLAMGLSPYNSGRCAAFINGYSGDLAWNKYRNGLTATDIIELIPQCLKDSLD